MITPTSSLLSWCLASGTVTFSFVNLGVLQGGLCPHVLPRVWQPLGAESISENAWFPPGPPPHWFPQEYPHCYGTKSFTSLGNTCFFQEENEGESPKWHRSCITKTNLMAAFWKIIEEGNGLGVWRALEWLRQPTGWRIPALNLWPFMDQAHGKPTSVLYARLPFCRWGHGALLCRELRLVLWAQRGSQAPPPTLPPGQPGFAQLGLLPVLCVQPSSLLPACFVVV